MLKSLVKKSWQKSDNAVADPMFPQAVPWNLHDDWSYCHSHAPDSHGQTITVVPVYVVPVPAMPVPVVSVPKRIPVVV